MENKAVVAIAISTLITGSGFSANAKGRLTYEQMLNSTLGDPGFEHLFRGCIVFNIAYADLLRESGTEIPRTVLGRYRLAEAFNAWFNLKGDAVDNRTEEGKDLFRVNFQKPGKEGYKVQIEKCTEAFSTVIRASEQGIGLPQAAEDDRHLDCLQAKDYEGCMRFSLSRSTKSNTGNECVGGFCIVNSKGTDDYGLLKPPIGWRYLIKDNGMIQYFSKPYRVPHKGQETRYVAIKRITRSYESPESGSSGTVIGGTTSSTKCVGYGPSITCSTTGTAPIYLPGKSSKPGGIDDTHFSNVYDCFDDTQAAYKDDKVWIGWERHDEGDVLSRLLKKVCSEPREYLKSLPVLGVRM